MFKRPLLGLAVGLGLGSAWLSPAFGLGMAPLVFSQTGHSMPQGFYLYHHATPAAVGEVVVEREPPDFKLPWLMKRVEGVAGSVYCWRADLGTHTLNGRVMPAPDARAERIGLKVWKECRALRPGEIVGYGVSSDSFDSRYRGPVEESRLWGVYRPVWLITAG